MDYQKKFIETIDNNIIAYGSRNMFCFNDGSKIATISYDCFQPVLSRLSLILKTNNIGAGDRVSVISSVTESYVALSVVLFYLGIVIVPIDVNLPASEKNNLIKKAKVKALFAEKNYADEIEEKDFNLVLMSKGCEYTVVRSMKAVDYEPSDPGVGAIMFSSGTTGTIKGVELTKKSIVMAVERMINYIGMEYKDVSLTVLPLSHVAGFVGALSLPYVGGASCFLESFNPNTLMAAFDLYKPSLFEVIPEVLELMRHRALIIINKGRLSKAYYNVVTKIISYVRRKTGLSLKFLAKPVYSKMFGPNIKCVGGGAAPFKEECIRFYLDLGLDFINVYGSTETCFPIAGYHHDNKYQYKGVGKADQFNDILIKIDNPDEHGVGEILVKSALIMNGYFEDEKLTEEAFSDGYFKTGDLGFIDSDNNLFIKGRIKENIVLSNGEKLTPLEIDEYYKMDEAKIAAVGVPTGNGTDELHLFIESEDEALLERIKTASLQAPKNYKVKGIHLIDKIPVTGTGKIKRFELRRMVLCEKQN